MRAGFRVCGLGRVFVWGGGRGLTGLADITEGRVLADFLVGTL